jgi:hypothetical protein
MDPRTIVMSLPMLRALWRWLPGPLRLPVLAVGAAIGIWYLVTGRKQLEEQEGREPPAVES